MSICHGRPFCPWSNKERNAYIHDRPFIPHSVYSSANIILNAHHGTCMGASHCGCSSNLTSTFLLPESVSPLVGSNAVTDTL